MVLLEQVVPQYQTEIPRRPIYRQFNVHNPSRFKGAKNPVGKVSWDDCQACLDKLNAKAGGQGGKFALPTETQWEYACQAGSTQSYSFGDQESRLGEYGWFDGNSGSKTHPVGEKKPNAAGLYDMHGNVWEWCQDWYGAYGAEAVTDPSGPTSGSNRVVRGGSQGDPGVFSRSSKRADNQPGLRWNDLGFRVSRVPAE
ncbi:MAG: formylglycine-generating enzyme family protein [Planctomycetota bacterium]|nr:formylglycine-generating enzyme family protein [Planctomycetota bacterium]